MAKNGSLLLVVFTPITLRLSKNGSLILVGYKLHYTHGPLMVVVFLWDHGFHCGTLKLLEGH